MAFNLDFSGWRDMRTMMADSIINQANIAAEAAAERRKSREQLISGLLSTGVNAYTQYKQDQSQKEQEALLAQNLLGAGDTVDPMQFASANGLIPNSDDKDYQEFIAWKKSRGLY